MNNHNDSSFDIDTWYQTPNGAKIAELEFAQLKQIPDLTSGTTLLQLGAESQRHWLNIQNNHHHFIACQNKNNNEAGKIVRCDFKDLPFPPNCFDTIILPHTLECNTNPKLILQESWRLLNPEGHLIIFGFNPRSIYGTMIKIKKSDHKLPACIKLHSINKIYQWLKTEHFEIIHERNFNYIPWLNHQPNNQKNYLEKIMTWLFPYCGGIYLLILKKRLYPLTPVRPQLKWRDILASKNLTEPAAGNVHCE